MTHRDKSPPALDLDDPQKREGPLVVRYKSDDGSEDGIIGLNEAIRLQVQAARIAGEYFGKKAKAAERAEQARNAAKKERTPRSAPLRAKIIELMGSYQDSEFKAFLGAWENAGALNGLRLTWKRNIDKYIVDDENDVGTPKPYTIGTLRKMFSTLE